MNEFENLIAILNLLKGAAANKEQVTEPTPFKVGNAYLIRSATMINVGRVAAVSGGFIVLADAAWIADTGRYHDALSKGGLNEVEPYPDGCFVAVAGIIDAAPWTHSLPLKQK